MKPNLSPFMLSGKKSTLPNSSNRELRNVARKAECKADGTEQPRHKSNYVEVASTAQRSSRLSAVVFQLPVKVLMLAPTPFFSDRGCHVRIYEEANALRSSGIDVRLVTYHLGRDIPHIPTYRICSIPWYEKLEAGPSWHKPYLDILLLLKAAKVAKTFAPDLIHAHLHEGAFIGFFLKKWLKVPMLFDYQGSMTAEITAHGFAGKKSVLNKFFMALERFINNRADLIVTSSTPSTVKLVNEWNMPPDRVSTVMDGVDTGFFHPIEKIRCKKELRLPLDIPVVGFLGLLNEYQGIDILLEAISIIKRQGGKIHFLIMGFPEKKYIEKSREMKVEDMVTFTGRIKYESAPEYLSACDVAVSPKISLAEANGKLFNYMACGVPAVVFDTPVNREILGETGIYADYGNAADLAEKIVTLLKDTEKLKDLSALTREKAVNEHSWQARGEKLLGLYQSLMGSKVT